MILELLILAATASTCFADAIEQPSPLEPVGPRHVVFVLLDDVGVDKLGAYGEHPTAGPTPVLDAMAAEGVLFRAAYAHPVCSPTRASILTGLQPAQTGIGGVVPLGEAAGSFDAFVASENLDWLPRRLTSRGILCDALGKWHLTHELVPDYHSHPIRVGFRRHAGHLGNLGDWAQTVPEDKGYWSWKKNTATAGGWSDHTSAMYATLDTAWEAYLSLQNAASAHRRSFTWLALNSAHKPWDMPPLGLFTGRFSDGPSQQEAVLEACDTILGQLRSTWALSHPSEAAQTLWIVMGDNGTTTDAVEPPWPATQSKATVTEGGVRVPLIVTGAGVVAGGECVAPVHAADLWATILELFGTPAVNTVHSVSFAKALRDPAGFKGRGWAHARFHQPNGFGPKNFVHRAARRADGWKLRETKKFGSPTAYRLNFLPDDPLEQVQLYPPATPEAAEAFEYLLQVMNEADAPLTSAEPPAPTR